MNEKKKQEIPIPFKLDDFFTTQENRDEESKEKIELIDLSLIDDFKEHPFKVIENEDLLNLESSIKQNGILVPTIVRKKEDGRYEMISGHRRKFACSKIGYETIPCIIKDLTDDEATIYMVDSNLQREELLPSEKAFAYKMKLDAIKHQGKRNDLTSVPVAQKSSREIVGDEIGESQDQVRRYIRLTHLNSKLLDMVDNKQIAFRPAVEISYLNSDEQDALVDFIEYNQSTPSLSQAIQLKTLSLTGKLDVDTLNEILEEDKPNQVPKIKFNESKIKKVLPKNIEKDKIEDYVVKSIEYYTRYLNRQREHERR